MSFRILGTGKSVPSYVLTNDEMATIVDTSDEWIRTRTGIRERRVCTTESLSDLTTEASKLALEDAGVSPEELDLIICATFRGEYCSPAQSCIVQRNIGATCPAFDVNAACSGFIYSLDVAAGFFARKTVKKVLVVAADNVTNSVDWEDRSTCVLCGDGCGAAVLGDGDDLLSVNLKTKGDLDSLVIPHGENTFPKYELGSQRPTLRMNGREVYKFAVGAMSEGLEKAIRDAGVEQEDINFVIPHQANIRIIDAARHKLHIPEDRYVCNIDRYGNTSAASVPIALDEINRAGKLKNGDLIAMSAFGAGLTSASCVLRWNK